MHIRFVQFTPIGNVHYEAGESHDFPDDVAELLVENGSAVAIPEAEFASLPRYGVHAAVPPANSPAPIPKPANSPAPKPKPAKKKRGKR